jgi:tetratricopeptide (TPR) repeat protein
VTVDGSPAITGRDAPSDDERWFLADERDFLRRSLDDAEREHDAGDLSDEDHALLVARDTTRLAEVEADLADLGPESASEGMEAETPVAPSPPWPLWRKVGLVAACLLIVTGGVILVTHYLQARQPGQASSGSVTLSQAQLIEQQLEQALALNNGGQTKAALTLYDKVLSEDPSNPAALAYAGYLQWNVGSAASVPSLVKIGRAEIERAIEVSPTYYEGHLFYGLVLENQDHNDAAAVVQFDEFLADDPPAGEPSQVAGDVAPAYQGVGRPVPAAFGTSSTSTSTSTSAP